MVLAQRAYWVMELVALYTLSSIPLSGLTLSLALIIKSGVLRDIAEDRTPDQANQVTIIQPPRCRKILFPPASDSSILSIRRCR
jgi:hypothetical protein